MNGAGNDFVITDNRITKTNFTPKTIAKLCDRNRGIGADGFMSVESPENDGDYRMRYYNADGNEAEMCGNGARCFARFVFNNVNRDKAIATINRVALLGFFLLDITSVGLLIAFLIVGSKRLFCTNRIRVVHGLAPQA